MGVLGRRQIAKRVMGSFLVVLEQPPVGGLAHVFQPDEQMLVQQLVAQRAIEPLDVGVLVRLARLDVLDRRRPPAVD